MAPAEGALAPGANRLQRRQERRQAARCHACRQASELEICCGFFRCTALFARTAASRKASRGCSPPPLSPRYASRLAAGSRRARVSQATQRMHCTAASRVAACGDPRSSAAWPAPAPVRDAILGAGPRDLMDFLHYSEVLLIVNYLFQAMKIQ